MQRGCLKGRQFHGVGINLYFDSLFCRNLYMRGHESDEFDFLKHFLRVGDIFIDVGANIGAYSLVAAKCVGPTGAVYAFEPHGTTYKRLGENIVQNKFQNVSTLHAAVSDVVGTASFKYSLDGHDAWNSLTDPIKGKEFGEETITTVTLDDFCSTKNLRADAIRMIKIDVEGWESNVIKGAKTLLSHPNAPLLQIEFSEEACQNNGGSCEMLAAQILDLGFGLYVYTTASNRLARVHDKTDYSNKNVLCIKNPDLMAIASGARLVV